MVGRPPELAVPRPLVVATAPLLLFTLACFSGPHVVKQTDYEREISQRGLAPAPSGPHATGPLARPGALALEGVLSSAVAVPAATTRDEGAPGEYSANDWGRARLSVGMTRWLEAGLQIEGSPADWAEPLATDIDARGYRGVLGRGGPQLRARAPIGGGWSFDGLLEAEGALLPYIHAETLTTTVTTWKPGDGGPDVAVTSSEVGEAELLHRWYWTARAGLGFAWTSPGGVDVSLGTSAENLPSFYGRDNATWGCTDWSDGSRDCGEEPDRPADLRTVLAVTGTLALAVPIRNTPFTLLAAVNGHFGDDPIVASTPVSGDVGLRLSPRAKR